jgi:hypothetical protein
MVAGAPTRHAVSLDGGGTRHMESSMKGFVDDIESTEHFAGKTTE